MAEESQFGGMGGMGGGGGGGPVSSAAESGNVFGRMPEYPIGTQAESPGMLNWTVLAAVGVLGLLVIVLMMKR